MTLKKITLIISIFFIFNSEGSAQVPTVDLENTSFEDLYFSAVDLCIENHQIQALPIWKHLAKKHPNNANVNYHLGKTLYELNINIDLEPYFKIAQANTVKNYNPLNSDNEKAPEESIFYYGVALHKNGDIKNAIQTLNAFKNKIKSNHFLYKKTELHIKQCHVAEILIKTPIDYKINNLGETINTKYPEYNPTISLDGTSLFFTSKRIRKDSSNYYNTNPIDGSYYEDIYVSYTKDSKSWSDPNIVNFSKSNRNETNVSASADGQKIFVYQDDEGDGNIYVSKIEDTSFSEIQFFEGDLNSKDKETFACISPDGNTIYFVSDRKGGHGGTDIYRIKKLPNGEWSLAQNLGKSINTEYDEESPFIGADGRTLYFASNGEHSMGGFDLFTSQIDKDGAWSKPKNMGYPLNRFNDDLFYTTTADGYTGYFASQRKDNFGERDIYQVNAPTSLINNVAIMRGFISMDDGSTIPKGIKIIVLDKNQKKKLYKPRRIDGGYVFDLTPCEKYRVEYQFEGKTIFETKIAVECHTSYQEINKVILINPLTMEAKEEGYDLNYNTVEEKYWQINKLGQDQKYLGTKVEIYEDGVKLYEEIVNNKGQFPYRTLKSDGSYLLKVKSSEDLLCDSITIELIDANGEVTFTTEKDESCNFSYNNKIIKDTDKVYEKYFGYNEINTDEDDKKLNDFINTIAVISKNSDKKITIKIVSSSSTVPTKRFNNNKNLAQKRHDNIKNNLIKGLKHKNIDPNRITFTKEIKVQGPNYKNDPVKNKALYAKYQFIKLVIH